MVENIELIKKVENIVSVMEKIHSELNKFVNSNIAHDMRTKEVIDNLLQRLIIVELETDLIKKEIEKMKTSKG